MIEFIILFHNLSCKFLYTTFTASVITAIEICVLRFLRMIVKLFIVPPQIHPFSFGDEAVNSGELVTVTCAISKGDLPLNITWALNGRSINVFDGVATGSLNRRISQLTIESAQAHHSGEYICLAQNVVGVDKYSSYLNVNGIFHVYPLLILCFLLI